jgi:hypothetical protein
MSTLLGAVFAAIIGVLLLVWTAHIILHILGWILIVGGIIWAVRFLVAGTSNRTRL